ncbi:TraR/DksA family transcriptional regulator [Frigoriglobus tundricola]|uniref:DksA C4-type domain-containing protein n=1 Tax=Frigoriglobus tundricola TaxID=2774151 RepID=A0A6M5YIL7_9BACT|nr:TraR/DksA C4-type zinc finger protein [Frigoriglobus tundricola]QJW93865.1 DksA C4-type domain-containing protein [Frigoriglobus tundricola]
MSTTAIDLWGYRQRLLTLAERLSHGVSQLTSEATRPTGAEGTAAEAPAHDPTATSTAADEEVALSVLVSEGQILAEVRAAIARFEAGTFGRCEKCGRAVSRTRLDAVPYARHCIRCARADESNGTN